MSHIVYFESPRSSTLYMSKIYEDYDSARSFFDKLRINRGSTDGLWLFEEGSDREKRFLKAHKKCDLAPLVVPTTTFTIV